MTTTSHSPSSRPPYHTRPHHDHHVTLALITTTTPHSPSSRPPRGRRPSSNADTRPNTPPHLPAPPLPFLLSTWCATLVLIHANIPHLDHHTKTDTSQIPTRELNWPWLATNTCHLPAPPSLSSCTHDARNNSVGAGAVGAEIHDHKVTVGRQRLRACMCVQISNKYLLTDVYIVTYAT